MGLSIALDGVACADWGAGEEAALIGALAATLAQFGCEEENFGATSCLEARRRLQTSGVSIGTTVSIDGASAASGDDPVTSLNSAITQAVSDGTLDAEMTANAGTTNLNGVTATGVITNTMAPSSAPSVSQAPSPAPSAVPTRLPTAAPSAVPSPAPTVLPTAEPSASPTAFPTALPTALPTAVPSALPTGLPTSAPTAPPSAAPTQLPTAAPSAVPSPAPTPTTALIVTDILSFGATKPHTNTQSLFVVNQNGLEKMFGNITIEAANVSWTIEVDNKIFHDPSPATYEIESNNLKPVYITLDSTGLAARLHPITIKVDGKTTNSLRVQDEQTVNFDVTSYATAANSVVEVAGDPPVMAAAWGERQVSIKPYDGDNQPISKSNLGIDNFDISLTSHESPTNVIRCEYDYEYENTPDFHYYAQVCARRARARSRLCPLGRGKRSGPLPLSFALVVFLLRSARSRTSRKPSGPPARGISS